MLVARIRDQSVGYGVTILPMCSGFVVAAEIELEHPAGFESRKRSWSRASTLLLHLLLEMSILRPFKASDMFKFNNVYVGSLIDKHLPHTIYSNLDVWTETVNN